MADLPGLVEGGQEPAPNLVYICPKVFIEAVGEILAYALKLVDDSDERVEAVAERLILEGESFHLLHDAFVDL